MKGEDTMVASKPPKPSMSLSLDERIIDGVEDLTIDEVVTLQLKVRVTGIDRDKYMTVKKGEKAPIRVSADVISGEITNEKSGLKEKIEDEDNLDELEKLGKKI